MRTFNEFWELLSPKAEYANRRKACFERWNALSENQQNSLYETIWEKLSKGKYVDYNPLFAMKNNSLLSGRAGVGFQQVLSFAEYYARYGTTEPRDGWQQANPTGNKVIYIKTN